MERYGAMKWMTVDRMIMWVKIKNKNKNLTYFPVGISTIRVTGTSLTTGTLISSSTSSVITRGTFSILGTSMYSITGTMSVTSRSSWTTLQINNFQAFNTILQKTKLCTIITSYLLHHHSQVPVPIIGPRWYLVNKLQGRKYLTHLLLQTGRGNCNLKALSWIWWVSKWPTYSYISLKSCSAKTMHKPK